MWKENGAVQFPDNFSLPGGFKGFISFMRREKEREREREREKEIDREFPDNSFMGFISFMREIKRERERERD